MGPPPGGQAGQGQRATVLPAEAPRRAGPGHDQLNLHGWSPGLASSSQCVGARACRDCRQQLPASCHVPPCAHEQIQNTIKLESRPGPVAQMRRAITISVSVRQRQSAATPDAACSAPAVPLLVLLPAAPQRSSACVALAGSSPFACPPPTPVVSVRLASLPRRQLHPVLPWLLPALSVDKRLPAGPASHQSRPRP